MRSRSSATSRRPQARSAAGLDRIVAFSRLLHDAGRTEMEREGGIARVYPGCRGLPFDPPRQVAEFTTASVVLLGRMVTGQQWSPREVHFTHRAPTKLREHQRIFGVTPIFDAKETMVVLDASVLAMPVRTGGSQIGAYLEAYARELLARLPETETSVRARVERALATGVTHGIPDVGAVASQLAMTPRTLQRRLSDEGTTFAELSDRVRRSAAERYLKDARLPARGGRVPRRLQRSEQLPQGVSSLDGRGARGLPRAHDGGAVSAPLAASDRVTPRRASWLGTTPPCARS